MRIGAVLWRVVVLVGWAGAVVGVVVGLATQSSCEACEPLDARAMTVIMFMIFTGPAIAALALGVALRRLPRRRPPHEQHA
jgi:hypothetical protein